MNHAPVAIPRSLVNQLFHYSQESPLREVCGLIGGRAGMPESLYPVANVAELPECRFLLDARGQIEAMKKMRERGEELFAIFHTHPTSPAQPSELDAALAAYPEALYLIISLNTRGLLEMRGFRLASGLHFEEIELSLGGV